MAKPETTFTASVHRHLPPPSQLHREKMANPYRGGAADYWYSGGKDLWIEWKFLTPPKRPGTLIDLVSSGDMISPLQREWLKRRLAEGRNVWVVVGHKAGGVIFKNLEWENPLTAEVFLQRTVSRQRIASTIEAFTRP